MTAELEQLRAELTDAIESGDRAAVLAITQAILERMTPAQQRAAAARLQLAMARARPS